MSAPDTLANQLAMLHDRLDQATERACKPTGLLAPGLGDSNRLTMLVSEASWVTGYMGALIDALREDAEREQTRQREARAAMTELQADAPDPLQWRPRHTEEHEAVEEPSRE